jgi:hypothetical protein
MAEKARLIIEGSLRGETLAYKCSLCRQVFLLPDDRTPKEAVAEVWAAFQQHVREEHPENVAG